MIYGFIQQSGGQVLIKSAVGQGTTVRLYLPRISERFEEEPVSVNLIEAPRAEQGETVLIVDDDPSDRSE